MPDFETAEDAGVVVRHSPEEGPPFYYVAGMLLASTADVADEVKRVLAGLDFQDVRSEASHEVAGLYVVEFTDDDDHGVLRALDRLADQAGSVAPNYVLLPSSHKNVYGASKPQGTDDLLEIVQPGTPLVGVPDVGFVDSFEVRRQSGDLVAARTDKMTLPETQINDSHRDYGHGESVAWLVSRYAPGAEIRGWEMNRIPSANPQDALGAVTDSVLARAIHDAIDAGCMIITVTVGGAEHPGFKSVASGAAIDRAEREDVLVIAAAGNDADPSVAPDPGEVETVPAAWPSVLAVGANSQQDSGWVRESYSNHFREVAVRAPGTHVVPFKTGNARVTGTSFAVAVIAGIVADRWHDYLALGGTPRRRALHLLEHAHGLPVGLSFGPG